MGTTNDGHDITRFIREQHNEIRRLFSEVEAGRGDDRRDVFECLVRLLAVHETAEEEVVYPAIRSAETGDEVAKARIVEEAEAKQMLSDLERLGAESPEFPAQLAVLREAVLRHAENEERTVLPLLAEIHDHAALERMGNAARVAESLAPTHPHPHGPTSALGNIAVGPAVAIMDRARDALRNVLR